MMQNQIPKNHMDIPWHQFTGSDKSLPITQTGLTEKASVIGRTGLMMLSCGTGAWRVRSSMNSLATLLGVTCTADIGLMSIEYTCFDGTDCYSQSLCLTNTGVNTSKLNRLERFVNDFDHECCTMSGEQIHTYLDQIEQIHGLYSPFALGCASALACSAFTFLLGGGPIEMLCAFFGAGIGNYLRCKLTKHHFTLFLCIAASVSSACLVYAGLLKIAELLWGISIQHEAGYICAMLFIIPGFPFITSGIDLAKLDMRSGLERLQFLGRELVFGALDRVEEEVAVVLAVLDHRHVLVGCQKHFFPQLRVAGEDLVLLLHELLVQLGCLLGVLRLRCQQSRDIGVAACRGCLAILRSRTGCKAKRQKGDHQHYRNFR